MRPTPFEFEGKHFLVESKWTEQRVSNKELSFFITKVSQLQPNPIGLFITSSDFSEEAIRYWESAKDCTVILVDGYDLTLVLEGRIELPHLLQEKVRAASQEGKMFRKAVEILREN